MRNSLKEHNLQVTRRQLFGSSALGLGTAAMAGLFSGSGNQVRAADLNGGIHHKAKAKRVIYLFMSGGPSHLDLWDYKPKMQEKYGQDLPEEVRDGRDDSRIVVASLQRVDRFRLALRPRRHLNRLGPQRPARGALLQTLRQQGVRRLDRLRVDPGGIRGALLARRREPQPLVFGVAGPRLLEYRARLCRKAASLLQRRRHGPQGDRVVAPPTSLGVRRPRRVRVPLHLLQLPEHEPHLPSRRELFETLRQHPPLLFHVANLALHDRRLHPHPLARASPCADLRQ